MSTMADVNTAMRERVTHLERRYGRKRVYLVSGLSRISLFFRQFAPLQAGRKQRRHRQSVPFWLRR